MLVKFASGIEQIGVYLELSGMGKEYGYQASPLWRMDQLISLLGEFKNHTMVKFAKWLLHEAYTLSSDAIATPERTMLSFVMKEKFNKGWDGEEWIEFHVDKPKCKWCGGKGYHVSKVGDKQAPCKECKGTGYTP